VSHDLTAEIASLRELSRQQLKDRWRGLYRTAPPIAFTPDLLARGIAWRLQEKVLGRLSEETRRLLQAGQSGSGRKGGRALRPGNRLVRRWRGRTYVVEVTEHGLSYENHRYGSLSEIARAITGTRWSGPKFFGLGA
jgi:hypothetical protein